MSDELTGGFLWLGVYPAILLVLIKLSSSRP